MLQPRQAGRSILSQVKAPKRDSTLTVNLKRCPTLRASGGWGRGREGIMPRATIDREVFIGGPDIAIFTRTVRRGTVMVQKLEYLRCVIIV